MTNNLKITYSHVFPDGYPINQIDVDELQTIRADAIKFIQDLLRLSEHDHTIYFIFSDRHLPSILLSDAKMVNTYGTYSWEDIFNELDELYSVIEGNSMELSSDLLTLLRKIYELIKTKAFGVLNVEARYDVNRKILENINKLVKILRTKKLDGRLKDALLNIIEHTRDIKHYSNRYGSYSGYNNIITLYANNILDRCEKINPLNLRDTVLGYMEIVLVHEMAHAFHFRYVGHDNKERIENWINLNTRPRGYKKSVIEGFARWIEAEWCRKRMGEGKYSWRLNNTLGYSYDKRFDEILHEADTKSYPGWPYAAGSMFVKYPEIGYEIFKISSIIGSYGYESNARWRNAYRYLR